MVPIADNQRQTGVTTRHGMTDAVAFKSIEKQDLVCFGYGLVKSNVPHVYAAVRKHQLSGSRALFGALMAAGTPAVCVPNGNGWRSQQTFNNKFGDRFGFVS